MIQSVLHKIGKLWKRTPWGVLLLFFAVPFLLRNLLLPMVGDDFSYAFIWDGEHYGNLMDDIGPRERIDSVSDIIVSQWSHYFTWGGRTFSMFFIQLFAWTGKVWFDLANTVVFVLLMLTLYWLAVGKIASPARHKGTFLWVMLCMLFGVLDYMSTMLWMTGACVYLWSGLWECLFLLPYVLRYEELRMKDEKFATAPQDSPAEKAHAAANAQLSVLSSKFSNLSSHFSNSSFLLFYSSVFGLLAGWSEEAGSLVTVVLTAYFLYSAWRQKRLKRWMVVGFVFLLIGCGVLMLCPGSLHREQLMLELAPAYVLPADKLFSAEMFWDNFTEGFLPILVWESFLFIPIVLLYASKKRAKNEELSTKKAFFFKLPTSLLFAAAGILVLMAMMFAPEFAVRTGFHSTLFLTVGSAAAFKEIVPWLKQVLAATPLRRTATFAVGTLCTLYGLFVMAGAFYIEGSYRQQFDSRLDYVMQHKDQQQLVVTAFRIPYGLDSYIGPRSLMEEHLIYGADLESKTTDNRSLMYAQYYGLPPICIDRQIDWKVKSEK